jgi:hypothetical protein
MAYIGSTPTSQSFISGTDYFNGTGSQTAFTLTRTVASVNDIQAVVNNVVQVPSDAYTISGTTITFTSAPSAGTSNVYVRYLSTTTQVITPSQGTVGTSQLGTITNIASGNTALTLQTGSTPTTAVTVDTSQNVGIGTAIPLTKLHVDSSSTTYSANIRARNSNFGNGVIGAASGILTVATDMNNLAFYTASNLGVDGTSVPTNERMRIASTGDVMIGTTSANGKVTINQTDINARTISASSPASYAATAFRSDSAATSGTGWYHLYGSSSAGSVNNIFIYGNGNIQNANNSYGAISDSKLKENITDATPKLDKLMQVKVRNYNLIGEYEQHKQIGVIAQELEQIFPSMIEETQDRGENDELLETTTKSVKYSVFVPMLIKALQELNTKVDAQATTIAELQARLPAENT